MITSPKPLTGEDVIAFLLIAAFCTGITLLSHTLSRHRREQAALGATRDLLSQLPWQRFEQLAACYFEECGYTVRHTGRAGPDGGFDLELYRGAERTLVQCKRWQREDVPVQAVREFFGVVCAEGAHRGIFITTGRFTVPALQFGGDQPSLDLIPGDRFAAMVRHLTAPGSPFADTLPAPLLQARTGTRRAGHPSPAHETVTECPACPRCAAPMVLRHARSGRHSGGHFWGCSNFAFTRCRGTRPAGANPAVYPDHCG